MNTDTVQWYKQFWPWFLIILPASAVIASIFTIMIATKDNDGLVVDDYYKAGLAINQTMDRIELAKQHRVAAKIQYANTLMTISLSANDNTVLANTDQLQLHFVHPTQRKQDVTITLRHAGGGKYIAKLDKLPVANWYLQLEPVNNISYNWRIDDRIQLNDVEQLNNYKLIAK